MRCLEQRPRVVLALLSLLLATSSNAQEAAKPIVIEAGRQVSIEYTLTLDDGSVADSNVGGEVLVYEQGKSQLLPAVETALLGLSAGDTKKVSLTAEQGYGPVDPELRQTVPLSALPETARQVGVRLVAQAPDGRQRPVKVVKVEGEQAVLDLNHPLAGEALHFDIKVMAVE